MTQVQIQEVDDPEGHTEEGSQEEQYQEIEELENVEAEDDVTI